MVISQFPAKFGKYILLDRLNAGGMAEVFRAKVTGVEGFERLLAIKCMLPQLLADEHFKSMFQDEARLAVQLKHANIVQIEELGQLGERLYIAMELVNGRDLRHILRTAKSNLTPIPPSFAAYVIAKAAEGLDFAHRKAAVDGQPLNLVHRDVSPQNILVSYDGEVKVVDFGIAKADARSTETQAGVLKGKFAYMAPEQVAGVAIDRRADIFALGSVLFEVVTGQRLFSGDTDLAVLEKVRNARLPDFASILPPGSEDLAHVLTRALARDPDERYAHASEMAEDLEHLLIEDRSIFGSKRAAQVMQTLYADDVTALKDSERRYRAVTAESCVVVIGEEATGPHVYESTFTATLGQPPPKGGAPTPSPMPMSYAPVGGGTVSIRKSQATPVTGVGTRQLQLRRIVSSNGNTAVDNGPGKEIPTVAGRVLKSLFGLLSVVLVVMVVAVGVVALKLPPERLTSPGQLLKELEQLAPPEIAENIPSLPHPLDAFAPPSEGAKGADRGEPDADGEADPSLRHGRAGFVTIKVSGA
ncbi:MAG TPA: serine/threonine-protein kinase, partial [Myxococcota bacterium]|nr:serine/threonine-protein kinase [Myxococcota bacterium]